MCYLNFPSHFMTIFMCQLEVQPGCDGYLLVFVARWWGKQKTYVLKIILYPVTYFIPLSTETPSN